MPEQPNNAPDPNELDKLEERRKAIAEHHPRKADAIHPRSDILRLARLMLRMTTITQMTDPEDIDTWQAVRAELEDMVGRLEGEQRTEGQE